MTHSLVLEVPESIYQPIVEEAEAEGRKVEEIALERLAVKSQNKRLTRWTNSSARSEAMFPIGRTITTNISAKI